MNDLCSLLNIEIPIIQAPAGSVAGPDLCVAVSAAGGLGSMGLTWTPAQTSATHVREVRSRTSKPFAVNFALSFDPSGLFEVLNVGPPVVTFSWGDPSPYVTCVRDSGARIGLQVGSIEGVARAIEIGVDFIICQGIDAGGHVQSTSALEEMLGRAVGIAGDVPIIAAGGIVDGAGIAHALAAGAQGVMLGTRFVATRESAAHEIYKRAIVEAGTADTALTVCFDGCWAHAPHRVLRNSTLTEWEAAGSPPPGRRPGDGEIIGRTSAGDAILRYDDTAPRTGMAGDLNAMALYAGMGVSGIEDIPSAGELVQRMWADTQASNA